MIFGSNWNEAGPSCVSFSVDKMLHGNGACEQGGRKRKEKVAGLGLNKLPHLFSIWWRSKSLEAHCADIKWSVCVCVCWQQVPNGLGFLLGLAQLILYAMYMNHKDAKSRVQGLEEGRQSLIQPAEVHENGEVKNKIRSNYNTTRLP